MEKYPKVLIMAVILAIALIGMGAYNATAVACMSCNQAKISSNQEKTISVTGEGEVTVVPDICILSLGIEAQDKEVTKAQAVAAGAMNDVMTTLEEKGILEKDIQTSDYSIDPVWEERKIVAYRVKNMVKVKIRDVDKIGEIIDAAAKAGGDLTRIEGIRFSIDDPKPYYEDARRKAVCDAREKAEQLAELNGVKLGEPISVSESGGYVSSSKGYYRTMEVAGAPPISPGEMEIRLTVDITYPIR
ncbi:MAG: DUF541 domain-containing protein [Candidatus Methanolliviera hydrocarbonicum]|uniref:DUF541 domain-containing protein n=1 Tax=Candidatus Methanolliviera hydrocarbonicum TaxID=2491085 RepID=A0A520KY62_9EURY|nr:MAG: DUF541 domain-containing protein [Candidatus Methanolliviera hydrocarbonicum]